MFWQCPILFVEPLSERMKKYSSNAKKGLKKFDTLEYYLKMAREKLTMEETAHNANDATATKSKLVANAAQDKHHMALQNWLSSSRCMSGFLILATARLVIPMNDKWSSFDPVFFKKAGSHVSRNSALS